MKLENHDYENALLGCILLDNRVLDEYKVKSTLFDNALARRVFSEIEKARSGGYVADIREISLRIPQDAGRIVSLTDVPSAANVKFYYDSLVDLAKRRGLFKLAREVCENVKDDKSTDEVFSLIDKSLLEISDNAISGYRHIGDFIPETLKEIEYANRHKGQIIGIPTGFGELDKKTNGWQNGDFIVIGARPSRGKTALALNMASASARANRRVGLFSIEMTASSLIKRLIADWGNVQHGSMRSGFIGGGDIESIAIAAQELCSANIYIDDTANIKLNDFISSARKMKRNEKVDILFIDYLGLIDNKRDGMARWEQMSEVSKSIKGLARELNIPIVSLSQLTRDTESAKPTMANLRDSGSIEQDADVIGLLHRVGTPDDEGNVEIDFLLEKARNGTTGEIHMLFKPAYMRFKEVET